MPLAPNPGFRRRRLLWPDTHPTQGSPPELASTETTASLPDPAVHPPEARPSRHRRSLLPRSSSEIDFLKLDDGRLAEVIEDPEDPSRTLLAVWKQGQVSYTGQLEYHGRILSPLPRNNVLLRHIRLPRGAKPCKSVARLLAGIESLICRCAVLPAGHVAALANPSLSMPPVQGTGPAPARQIQPLVTVVTVGDRCPESGGRR